MSSATAESARRENTEARVATGVAEFDNAIEGGFPRGDLILVAGHPGSGKTMLSAQFLHHGASKLHEPGVYVSFAENRAAFLRNMQRTKMDFEKLERDGLFKFLDLITVNSQGVDTALNSVIAEIDPMKARRLVVDSFSAMAQAFSARIDARIVLHTILGRMTRLNGVTTILIAEKPLGSRVLGVGMEEFVSDAVVVLTNSFERGYLVRNLDVVKMRGTRAVRTRLHYDIGEEGVTVYPPLNEYPDAKAFVEKVRTGIEGLDRMLSGGMYKGSTMLVMGESGTGKTTSALQFMLRGTVDGEKTLFVSHEETAEELTRHAKSFGWNIPELTAKGHARVMQYPLDPSNVWDMFSQVRRELRDFKPTRLIVDSLTSVERVMDADEFFQAIRRLTSLGKSRGITCLATARTSEGALPSDFWVSSLADVILSLRQVESQSQLRRALVVFKARGSPSDSSIKEFEINQNGIVVEDRFSNLEQILSGAAHRSARVEALTEAFTNRPPGRQGAKGEVISQSRTQPTG